MFIPGGCFCCEPPEDPCVLSGCTWSSTDMSDTDLTAGTAYYNPVSGTTPDGSYEITNVQDIGTGNDLPCRKITIETAEAPQKPDTVYAICWKDNATHNPSTQCPLTSVSFCVESKRHGDSDTDLVDGIVFVVRQNGKIYETASQSVGVNWKRASGSYTSASFEEIGGTAHPNFTATGASIEFGFAVKLSVNEDEEPLDVVLLDNLCITRPLDCVCGIPNCDAYAADPDPGVVSSQCSVDDISVTTGTQLRVGGGYEAWAEVDWGSYDPHSSANIGVNTGVVADFSGNCQNVSSITVCLRIRAEADFSGATSGGSGPKRLANIGIAIKQGGDFYLTGTGTASLDLNEGSEVRTISFGTNLNRITSLPSTPISPTPGSQNPCYPNVAEIVDLNEPFEIVLFGGVNASIPTAPGSLYPKSTRVIYDNICVKAVYGPCPAGDMAATVSGVTMTFKPGSGCNSGFVSAAESAINSTLVLSQQATSGSSCQWRYSGVSGTVPGAVNYSLSLTLGGKVGDDYTTGSIRIVAGSAGNNMPAEYTLAAPFDPCAEDGTFNFVSAIGSANCLILSGSSPITVSLI